MRRLAILTLLALTATVVPAMAEMTHPQAGSKERKAILDAMRPSIEWAMNGPVEFVVDDIRVVDDWALVMVVPQRPGGGEISLEDSRFSDIADELDGPHTEALLKFENGQWNLVTTSIGATDVSWLGWAGGEVPDEFFEFDN